MNTHQKKYLRGLAHSLKPVVQVGQNGVTQSVLDATESALLDHELIKVRLREPIDKKALAASLAEGAKATLCGVIGHTVILYRRHPEEPKIQLPGS